MTIIQNAKEFNSALKYGILLRMNGSRTENEVATIGIVFGNRELPKACYEYFKKINEKKEIEIVIVPGDITSKIELLELGTKVSLGKAELNLDRKELNGFIATVESEDKVVLIFGCKGGCDYYVIGNTLKEGGELDVIILSRFQIMDGKKGNS